MNVDYTTRSRSLIAISRVHVLVMSIGHQECCGHSQSAYAMA